MEVARQVIEYLQGSVLVSLTIAFISGWASAKLVSRERRSAPMYFLAVGLLGLFLGEFMLFSLEFDEYIQPIAEFRLFFDLLAAFIGSFLIATIIHFIKPT